MTKVADNVQCAPIEFGEGIVQFIQERALSYNEHLLPVVFWVKPIPHNQSNEEWFEITETSYQWLISIGMKFPPRPHALARPAVNTVIGRILE